MLRTLQVLPDLWKTFQNHFALYSALVGIVGGFSQAFALLMISPTFIKFYSIRQGIIEGVMALAFLFISLVFISLIANIAQRIIAIESKFWRYTNMISWVGILVLISAIIGSIFFYLYLGLFICISYDIFIDSTLDIKREKRDMGVFNTQKAGYRAALYYLAWMLLYFHMFLYDTNSNDKSVENIQDLIITLNKKGQQYDLEYYNSDYIILNNSNKHTYKVVKMDDALKFCD